MNIDSFVMTLINSHKDLIDSLQKTELMTVEVSQILESCDTVIVMLLRH